MNTKPLPASFFDRPAREVAPELIGHRLLARAGRALLGGRIVEVEAYDEDDPASHSHSGPTARNRSMFANPGAAYVYLIYGMHLCLNAVCQRAGVGEAVLIRAITAEHGIETMTANRRLPSAPTVSLTNGPAKLAQALGIQRRFDGVSLCDPASPVWIACAPDAARHTIEMGGIANGPRIGISKGVAEPLRFWAANSPFVSRRPRPSAR